MTELIPQGVCLMYLHFLSCMNLSASPLAYFPFIFLCPPATTLPVPCYPSGREVKPGVSSATQAWPALEAPPKPSEGSKADFKLLKERRERGSRRTLWTQPVEIITRHTRELPAEEVTGRLEEEERSESPGVDWRLGWRVGEGGDFELEQRRGEREKE